jgi:hypothetical protein
VERVTGGGDDAPAAETAETADAPAAEATDAPAADATDENAG